MNELTEYITAGKKDRIITFVFGLVFFDFGVIIKMKSPATLSTVLMVAMFICGALLLYFSFSARIRQKKIIDGMKKNGRFSKALSDFASATPYAADTLRLGEEFIYRRKQTEIISYSEIADISAYDRTNTDNSGSEYYIGAKLKNGKIVHLCSIYGSNGTSEGSKIVELIHSKCEQ